MTVSETKQTDELRESQRMLLTLLGNLPGMVYRCRYDPEWPFEFVSQGCLELTGYDPDDLIANRVSWAELVASEDRARIKQAIQNALDEQSSYQYTYPLRTRHGVKWVWEQGQGVYDAGDCPQAVEGFITDVTERIEAHEALEGLVTARTRELQTLLEASRSLSATLELPRLIDLILDQLHLVVDYEIASIGLLDGDEVRMIATRAATSSPEDTGRGHERHAHDPNGLIWTTLRDGQPSITPDVRGDDPIAREFRAWAGDAIDTRFLRVRSWMAAPLIVRDELLGALFVASRQIDHFTPHPAGLVTAIANHAAVAIQNARLHEQARSMAALEERQRLARELHDSISQALFGISLGAETAQILLESDPAEAARPIDYVLQLARGGMAEMRALIFELRPESLQQEGIVAALEKQAAATRARHAIATNLSLCAEPDVPLAVKETLYRIAQEAMHNTVKHAQATTIALQLEARDAEIRLSIADDGIGFDSGQSFPGHLGLVSMRERIGSLGGALRIVSAPGKGTRIDVTIPRIAAPE